MSEAEARSFIEAEADAALEVARTVIAEGRGDQFAETLLRNLGEEPSWQGERILERLRMLDRGSALLPRFEEGLCDQRNAERRNAARSALAAMASPESHTCEEATETLVELLLHSPDSDARLLAAAALGESGNGRSRLPLERALADPDANVAAAAAEALGLIGDRRAVPALLEAAAQGDFWTRVSAVLALGRLRDRRGLPALAVALEDPVLAPAAASAVGDIGDPGGVALLRPALDAEGKLRSVALQSIARIYGANPGLDAPDWLREAVASAQSELLRQLWTERDSAAARLLGIAGTPDGAAALARAAGDPDLESAAAVGLASLPRNLRVRTVLEHLPSASQPARTVLLEVLPELSDPAAVDAIVDRLGDADTETRAAAAEALGRSDQALVLNALLRALEQPDLRLGAALALGRLGSERCEPLLKLLSDHSPDVRLAAANGLARCGVAEISSLVGRLQKEPDSRVKQGVIAALGEIGGDKVVSHLGRTMEDPDPTIRFAAARALGRSGAPEALEVLLQTLDDAAPEVRIAALNALGQLGDARAADVVGGHLDESNREIRRTAARALDRIASRSATERLIRTLQDPDREVRLTAIDTLRRIGGAAAADALAESVDVEPDPTVRNAASQTLLELRARGGSLP